VLVIQVGRLGPEESQLNRFSLLDLDVEFLGQAKTPWGTTSAGFEAHTKINRKDWGLNWNMALETGGFLVSDEIKIEVEAAFVADAQVATEAVA